MPQVKFIYEAEEFEKSTPIDFEGLSSYHDLSRFVKKKVFP